MSEVEWSEESGGVPARKRGIPKWVWFGCGGGCLLVTLVVAAIAVFGYRMVEDASDPEKQWPLLQNVLPFDERPESIDLTGFPIPGVMRQFVLIDNEHGIQGSVMSFYSARGDEISQMFDPDGSSAPFGLGAPVDGEAGQMEIQGQSVPYLRFQSIKGQPGLGPGIRIDLTPVDASGRVAELRRMRGDERITDEDVRAFFEPFDVWRER
jgi:hypothetical protein